MNIEKEIFEKSNVDFKKIEKYGFIKEKEKYIYYKNFMNESFKAEITIDKKGQVYGKVYDLQTCEEYTNIKTINTGAFVNLVREEYKNILKDIRRNCFNNEFFISKQANRITKYIIEKYGTEPEFLWKKFKGYGIFRNIENNKWYSIIMNIDRSKLDNSSGEVEIINVKVDRNKINNLINKDGYYEAYHMNKKDWVSIILDDTLIDQEIIDLINESYNLVNNIKNK